jgi:hypothetical protein
VVEVRLLALALAEAAAAAHLQQELVWGVSAVQELCVSIVSKTGLAAVVLGREGAPQEMVVAGDMADVVGASD